MHVDKKQKAKSHSIANEASKKKNGAISTFHFVDNRPETTVQRRLQKMAHRRQVNAVEQQNFYKGAFNQSSDPVQRVRVNELKAARWRKRGRFDWTVQFEPEGVKEGNGVIVQEIQNQFNSSDDEAWTPTPQYWEAWNVGAGDLELGMVDKGGKDKWYRPPNKMGSKGTWSMNSNVYFIKNGAYPAGFREGAVKDAGSLLSTTTAPSGLGTPQFTRSANGRWGPFYGHRGNSN